jgi:hypothetical protein
MACAAIDGVTVPVFSRLWMYWWERSIIGTLPQDSGADVIDEYDSDQQDGNIAESVYPYDDNATTPPPSGASTTQKFSTVAAYQPIAAGAQATIDAILTALDNKQPVAIGLAWSDQFTSAYEQGQVVTPAMFTYMGEGHALSIVGWAPPSAAHPNGVFILQGSWGIASPAETSLWPDAKAGDHYFDASLFTAMYQGQPIVSDVFAAVPMAAPATLSVQITPPSSATVGQPSAWSAQPTGLPPGSIAVYTWTFPTATLTGQNVSYTPTAAGVMSVTCKVSVASTGAGASATASITVQPAPAPGPPPSPPTGVTQIQCDAVFATVEQTLTAMLPQYAGNQGAINQINYAIAVAKYLQTDGIDPLFTTSGRAQWVTQLPKPEGGV